MHFFSLLVEVSNARQRQPAKEQRLLLTVIRCFRDETHGSRQSIYASVSKTEPQHKASEARLGGIVDALVAMKVVAVYEIHGKAEVYKLSPIGVRVLAAVDRGKQLSEALTLAYRGEGHS